MSLGSAGGRSRRLDQAHLILSRGGLPALANRVWRRLLRPLLSWETLDFFDRDVRVAVILGPTAVGPLESRLATPEDLRRLAELGSGELSPQQVEARTAAGDRCFLGLREGRIVHWTWLAVGSTFIPDVQAVIRLRRQQAYGYGALTEEAERGQGIQPAVVRFIIKYEKEHGFESHLYFVRRDNLSGRSVVGKTSPRPLRIRVVRCWRLRMAGGFLVTGISPSGDPLFEVDPSRVRALGHRAYWVRTGGRV